jgi:hypothetical protein
MKLFFTLFIALAILGFLFQPSFAEEVSRIQEILEKATETGDANSVLDAILANPLLLNERDSKGLSPLLFAVLHDNTDVVHQVTIFN